MLDAIVKYLLYILILCVASPLHAGWSTHVVSKNAQISPGLAVINYFPGEGVESFEEAVASLKAAGRIQHLGLITLHAYIRENDSFEREIFSALQASAPKDLAAAEASAGNMHNPKMLALSLPFDAAVLTTPTVKKLNETLAAVGLKVSRASHEKLTFGGAKGRKRFDCLLYLKVAAK